MPVRLTLRVPDPTHGSRHQPNPLSRDRRIGDRPDRSRAAHRRAHLQEQVSRGHRTAHNVAVARATGWRLSLLLASRPIRLGQPPVSCRPVLAGPTGVTT